MLVCKEYKTKVNIDQLLTYKLTSYFLFLYILLNLTDLGLGLTRWTNLDFTTMFFYSCSKFILLQVLLIY
jgi:hypothetical protein